MENDRFLTQYMSRVQNENKMEITVGDEQDILLVLRALFVGFGPVLSIVSYVHKPYLVQKWSR